MRKVLSSFTVPLLLVGCGIAVPEDDASSPAPATDDARSDDATDDEPTPVQQPGDDAPITSPPPAPGTPSAPPPGGVDTQGQTVCGGDLAEDTFRFGLCVCDDLAFAGELTSSSFRSSDPTDPATLGGGVGVNGNVSGAGDLLVGGSLVIGGNLSPAGEVDVAQELRVGGATAAVGDAVIHGDAWLEGGVTAIGMSVEGTLHTTSDLGAFPFVDAAQTSIEPFTVEQPCGCDDAIDVAASIAAARQSNNNEDAGLDSDALVGVAGDAELVLAGGSYVLDRIALAGDLTIRAQGPVGLYVEEDVSLAGRLEIALETDDAEVDLFIGGNIGAAGELSLGSADAPARVRTYIGGDGHIALAGEGVLGGALYAPRSTLAIAGQAELLGAAVIGRLAEAGSVVVRYDADLQDAGDSCEDPPAEDPPVLDDPPAGDEPPTVDQPGDDPVTGGGADDDAPVGDGDGADGDGADACGSMMDCDAPQQCVEGSCVFLDG
jgi:hypothetical protein